MTDVKLGVAPKLAVVPVGEPSMPEKPPAVLGGWKSTVVVRLLAMPVEEPLAPGALVVMVVTRGLVTVMLTVAGTVVAGASGVGAGAAEVGDGFVSLDASPSAI